MTNQEFFEAIGTQVEFDPIRAELRVNTALDSAQRTDYVFEQVGTEVTSMNPGEPVGQNEVVTSFGVNIKTLQKPPMDQPLELLLMKPCGLVCKSAMR